MREGFRESDMTFPFPYTDFLLDMLSWIGVYSSDSHSTVFFFAYNRWITVFSSAFRYLHFSCIYLLHPFAHEFLTHVPLSGIVNDLRTSSIRFRLCSAVI